MVPNFAASVDYVSYSRKRFHIKNRIAGGSPLKRKLLPEGNIEETCDEGHKRASYNSLEIPSSYRFLIKSLALLSYSHISSIFTE